MRKLDFCLCETKAQISCAVTAQLICTFVFATQIVHLLFYLNPKILASSLFLRLYRLVCAVPGQKTHCWFSHEVAQIAQGQGLHFEFSYIELTGKASVLVP